VALSEKLKIFEPGKGEVLREGEGVAVVAVGLTVNFALEAVDRFRQTSGLAGTMFDARWIKPLPAEQLIQLAKTHKAFLIVEEALLAGGFSSAVLELLSDADCLGNLIVRRIGLADVFVEHGSQKELRAILGLDADGVGAELADLWKKLYPRGVPRRKVSRKTE
jgi:1-deoxy-D-xylulose-5-phosphate synthase